MAEKFEELQRLDSSNAHAGGGETLHAGALEVNRLPEKPAITAAAAFAMLFPKIAAARNLCGVHHVFVGLVSNGSETSLSIILALGQSAIIGAHHKCNLRIAGQGIADRQVAIHAALGDALSRDALSQRQSNDALSQGESDVGVWDLLARPTLLCESGEATSAISGRGPIFVGIGHHHLAIVPLDLLPRVLTDSDDAWERLPKRTFTRSLSARGSTPSLPSSSSPSSSSPSSSSPSSGPTFSSSICASRLMPSALGLADLHKAQGSMGKVVATLTVQSGNEREEFALSESLLDRGIILGRSSHFISSEVSPSVSRVHLLIARINGTVVAIDTASSKGSTIGSTPFSSTVLSGRMKIWLSKNCYLAWRSKI